MAAPRPTQPRAWRHLAVLSAMLGACGGGSPPPQQGAPSPAAPQSAQVPVKAEINPGAMRFEREGLRVWLSSNYYPGVRSEKGHALYVQSFPEHHVVRVNAFDWAVAASSACRPGTGPVGDAPLPDHSACMAQFKRVLEESRPYLDALTRSNSTHILMVDLFRTPTWLSRSADNRPACGGGVLAQAHRPADYDAWRRLLDIAVAFFKPYDGAVGAQKQVATKVYYQFWNEPDLACNWQEDTPAFLEFFEQTARHLKAVHPGAPIGGPGSQAWDARIAADGARRGQNLAFDLVDFAKARGLPLDFMAWHYFSADYRGQLLDGVAAYRAFLARRGIQETALPLIINEWLPQDGNPTGLHRYLAPDAANAMLAFFETKVAAQGGLPWQDYGQDRGDAWGIVAYSGGGNAEGFTDAEKKPIFHVYEFFDRLARAGRGVQSSREDITLDAAAFGGAKPFKVGERALLVAQEQAEGCYRFAAWNRIARPEQGAAAYVLGQGVTLAELRQAYGADPETMLARLAGAIRAGQAFDARWTAVFHQAQAIDAWLTDMRDRREFAYTVALDGWRAPSVSQAKRVTSRRAGAGGAFIQEKSMRMSGGSLVFTLEPEEFAHAVLCGH